MLKLANKESWSSYIRLLKYCAPYKKRLVLAIISMVLAAVFSILPPWLLKNVIDDVLIKKQIGMLNLIVVAVILLYVGKAVFNYAHLYLMTWVGQRVLIDLRLELYDRTQRLSLGTLYSHRSGEFLSRITNDVGTLQNILASSLVDLVFQGSTFIGIICFIFYINWKLTVVTFAACPVVAFAISKTSAKLRQVGRTIQARLATVAAIAQEAISSIKIVRSFVTEEEEYQRFKEESYSHFRAVMRGTQYKGVLQGAVEVILITALAFVLWLGGYLVISGDLMAGELVAFVTYIGLLGHPLQSLSNSFSSIQQGAASADRVFEIIDMDNEVKIAENPVILSPMHGSIKFENVWFGYDAENPVLKGINLEIKAGETVAVVGATGAGKSTLGDLVMRFYDPQQGAIYIDGTDLRQLELKSYRRRTGVVQQDPVLMKGTLAHNIAYGFPAAVQDDLVRAAKIADIYDFIDALPEKFETEVGERGVTLSGGQRQRVAIARAVVRDPKILIMDEATSSLDALVEKQVQQAMNNAMEGRTSIVIAHRLSTIRSADRIIVLSGGKIVEQGTHDELLAANGHYSKLYAASSAEGTETCQE